MDRRIERRRGLIAGNLAGQDLPCAPSGAGMRGPKIFSAFSDEERTVVSEQDVDGLAARLARALAA
jgi:hypothetical protein